jgi:cysteine desulfurase
MHRVIYMDHQATTPVDGRVLERMLPFFTEKFGNAASKSHPYGWEAEEAVEVARKQVAALVGAQAQEVVFTSGATEANNLAILGVAEAYAERGKHLVTQATEHKAVLDVMAVLGKRGWGVTVLGVDREGYVRPPELEQALRPETTLVSIMAANNEIGTLQRLPELGAICKKAGVLLHVDAAQAAGKVPLDCAHFDLASLSAHKIYGPKGVGALYVRRKDPRVELNPLVFGGGHERGRRSGTLNVPGIVGFGAAAELSAREMALESPRLRMLATRLYEGIRQALPEVVLNGPPPDVRLPGNLNLGFAGVEAETLILAMRHVAVSSGSACTSATLQPSHVLSAIGLPPAVLHGSLRLGAGRTTTLAEVDEVAAQVVEQVKKLRQLGRSGISKRA